ncbi:2-methylcitrate dehydratase PrpD [Brevibacterium sanguinis]|uniref:2-methylcitrate dehydratase PrpD n=2 Tax=Brevibacterium TaxID=1696 RepID=A0A366ID71_9MICO|nr:MULTISPECIES: MmgE/PrpD family protein [Brevibacterium]RBP61515.1 2-methylcitrate dehydratase PrpD [Brevibacterium sanguinis]RBP68609.1 2-methylcitrate dehydratase PrpD [Brevibacterium celere]
MNSEGLQRLIDSARALVDGGADGEAESRARLVFADTVSVAIAAGQRAEARDLVADHPLTGRVRHEAPSDLCRSSLLTAGGGWASAENAAYINGSILCALEMDEGTRPTGHPAAHVVPAVLAAAQAWECDLGSVLDALLFGYEVSAYLLESHRLTPGVHPHGHIGGIGAAAAVALLGGGDPLPAAKVAATSMLATHWGSCLDGSSARNTWTGQSAAAAVRACQLASMGWTGGTSVLDALLDGPLAQEIEAEAPYRGRPRIFNGYFKFYSACALTHTSIEAALGIRGVEPENIESVRVRTTRNNLKVADGSLDTALSRRFSIPFAVAAALVEGRADPDVFDDPSAAALSVAHRVHVEEDPSFTACWPADAPTLVEVVLTDGTSLSARCDNARGVVADEALQSELRDKAVGLHVLGGKYWDIVMRAPRHLPVRRLMESIQPPVC